MTWFTYFNFKKFIWSVLCMHTHVAYVYVCSCGYVWPGDWHWIVGLCRSPTCFLRQCLSLNLELIDSQRLAGQQAPGSPVSALSALGLQVCTNVCVPNFLHGCWGYRCAPMCLAFYLGAGSTAPMCLFFFFTWVLVSKLSDCTAITLPTEPTLHPQVTWFLKWAKHMHRYFSEENISASEFD